MSLLDELKRRNVLRVGAAYVVVSWLGIQIAETIFPLFGYGDGPARLIVIVLTIGFVPALVFSWAFELTPEGLKKEEDVDRSRSITLNTGKRLDQAIMVVLALALGYFAFDKFIVAKSREASIAESARIEGRTAAIVESFGDKSIAVLPFVNMSDDAANEYFSDGISEELLNLLARIPELRVISRSSAFSFKGKDINIPDVAAQLNVAHILEGSVRKSGNTVRITAQLIDGRADAHIWSETYDRSLDNIFAIQDEIASMVVEKLKVTLLGEVPTTREIDPKAYSLYLQGRHRDNQRRPESWEQAIDLYQQALAIAPDYAAAWSGLGGVYINQSARRLRPLEEGLKLARATIDTALSFDPDNARALGALGWMALYFDNEFSKAAEYFERALKLEPGNLWLINHAATLSTNIGRVDEAISMLEYIVDRDPINSSALLHLALSYTNANRPDEALPLLQTVSNLTPGQVASYYVRGLALLRKGEPQAALVAFQKEVLELFKIGGLVMAYHDLGRSLESDATLAEMMEKHEQDNSHGIAQVLAYRGEVDRAFKWLDKAMEYQDPGMTGIADQWEFARLHDDPRWLPFLEKIGGSPEQLSAIQFDVVLPGQNQ